MEFPRLCLLLSAEHVETDSFWNLPRPTVVRALLLPHAPSEGSYGEPSADQPKLRPSRFRQRLSVQSALGCSYSFDFDRLANETSLGGVVDEKRWDALALSFLKHLSRKKAVALVLAMQNLEGLVGRIGMQDIFKHNDPVAVFDVCVADREAQTVGESEELLLVDSELLQ